MINEKNRIYGKTKEISLDKLKELFNHKELNFIKIALLFGSRARGDYHNRSDYDFAILMDNSVDKSWGAKTTAYLMISKVLQLD